MKPWLRNLQTKRLFNAAKYGGHEYVCDAIRMGADATRISTRMHRTALIMNCGGNMPSLSIVQQLLAAGVDVHIRDITGRTALEWARLRLAEMGPWTPEELPTRSKSLDEFGNVILHDFEQQHLDDLRNQHPEMADEFIQGYMDARREAALSHFNPRAEYESIIPILERAMQTQPAA